MKSKYIITISVAVVLMASLSIYGYFSAIPEEQAGQDYPKIEISPAFFDSGEIEYGDIKEYTFQVTNSGKAVLEINKVATSCGCTTASVTSEQIEPGQTTELSVRYDSGAMSGAHARQEQERIIYIKSNDPNNPQIEVTIKAYVK